MKRRAQLAIAGLVLALIATGCSAFNPNVGPLLIDAGPAGCSPSAGGYGGGYGYPPAPTEDAGAGCGDAS